MIGLETLLKAKLTFLQFIDILELVSKSLLNTDVFGEKKRIFWRGLSEVLAEAGLF